MLSVAIAACGGDDTSPAGAGGGASATAYTAFCGDYGAAIDSCPDDYDGNYFDKQSCGGLEACYTGVLRDDAEKPLYECLLKGPCASSESDVRKQCFRDVHAAIGQSDAEKAWIAALVEFGNRCDPEFDGTIDDADLEAFVDDDFPELLLSDELYEGFAACAAGECDAYGDCRKAFYLERFGEACNTQAVNWMEG